MELTTTLADKRVPLIAGLFFVAGIVLYVIETESRLSRLEEDIRRFLQVDVHVQPLNFARNAAIFNSWENAVANSHTRYIAAWGENREDARSEWKVARDGMEGSFSYAASTTITPQGEESSGGWVAFYHNPIDRLRYRSLTLLCKVQNATGTADVGIRLVVDNPRGTGDRELAVYELTSLAQIRPLTSEWQAFEIDLSRFRAKAFTPPFPIGVDANTVNKVVFFVTPAIVKNCERATISFRNVDFQPSEIESVIPSTKVR